MSRILNREISSAALSLTWHHVNDACTESKKGKKNMKASLILTAACSLHAQFLQSRYKHVLDVFWAWQMPHAPPTFPDHSHSAHIHIYLLLIGYQKGETCYQKQWWLKKVLIQWQRPRWIHSPFFAMRQNPEDEYSHRFGEMMNEAIDTKNFMRSTIEK